MAREIWGKSFGGMIYIIISQFVQDLYFQTYSKFAKLFGRVGRFHDLDLNCTLCFFLFATQTLCLLLLSTFKQLEEGKHNIHQKFSDEFNRLVLEFFSE